jgi:hypothetical protein
LSRGDEHAGLKPHVLGVNVTTQADVLGAILKERRSELALEGDRWPDLVRLGLAGTGRRKSVCCRRFLRRCLLARFDNALSGRPLCRCSTDVISPAIFPPRRSRGLTL